MRCFMAKRCDCVFVSAGRILDISENPVVLSGRMWVQAKSLPQVVDTLDSVPLECLQFPQERPRLGMVRADAKCCRQLLRSFIRLTVVDQHVTKNRMAGGIIRIKRHRLLGSRTGERTMLHPFSPMNPSEGMAHRQPGVCLREARIEFDCSLKKRASRSVALRRLRYQHPPPHKKIVGVE